MRHATPVASAGACSEAASLANRDAAASQRVTQLAVSPQPDDPDTQPDTLDHICDVASHTASAHPLPAHYSEETSADSHVDTEPSPTAPACWHLPICLLEFQRQDSFHILRVEKGDNLLKVLHTAGVVLAHDGPETELFVPDPQPQAQWLTVVRAPRWWRHQGLHAVLVAARGMPEPSHVALYHFGVTIPSLLPPVDEPSRRHVDVYNTGREVQDSEDVAAGTMFLFQDRGSAMPVLPSVDEIIADHTLDCAAEQMPRPAPIPNTQYLLLGEEFQQSVLELAYGSVTRQVADAVGITAIDTTVWFQRGPSGIFGPISVRGVMVEKCIAYRCCETVPVGVVLFIDPRHLGKPVCSRLFATSIFRAYDFLDAVDVCIPDRYEVRFSGGDPVAGDPMVLKFTHCASVNLWVVDTAPGVPLPSPTESDHLTDDADDSPEGGGPSSPPPSDFGDVGSGRSDAASRERSRSPAPRNCCPNLHTAEHAKWATGSTSPQLPRIPTPCRSLRGPLACLAGPEVGDAPVLSEVQVGSARPQDFNRIGAARLAQAECNSMACAFMSVCGASYMWKRDFPQDASLHCHSADTSVPVPQRAHSHAASHRAYAGDTEVPALPDAKGTGCGHSTGSKDVPCQAQTPAALTVLNAAPKDGWRDFLDGVSKFLHDNVQDMYCDSCARQSL